MGTFTAHRFLMALLMLFTLSAVQAQYESHSKKANKNFQKAREYYQAREDADAEKFLHKTLEADSQFADAWFMLAQLRLDRGEALEAIDYYLKGLKTDPEAYASGYLTVADLEYEYGLYRDAWSHLEQWRSLGFDELNEKAVASTLTERLTFALNAIDNPVPFDPIPLGPSINSEQYEYWPSLSVDGSRLFFTVLVPQNEELPKGRLSMQEDFYFSQLGEEGWMPRKPLGQPVNTNANEGAQTVSANGKVIYFTGCERRDGLGKCDIYRSMVLPDGSWTKPENLGLPVNTRFSEKHPTLSADGRTLYFASNRTGGKGSYDIWKSEWDGMRWSMPENMGDSINTRAMEQSPFIHPDGQSLYFSSHGWLGMGKGDIFLSRKGAEGSWSSPVNLGYPVNTHNEEVGFIVDAMGNMAYYSSNRRSGTDTDIIRFELPEPVRPVPVSYISGRVYDARSFKGIEALFQLIDLESGEVVMESASNPAEGDYFVSLPGGKSYAFNVAQPGYLFYSEHFEMGTDFSRMKPYRKDIPMEPLRSGRSMVLNNVFYKTDAWALLPSSRVELNKVVELLERNPGLRVEISGHTDNTGTEAYNRRLSEKRAGEVVRYLKKAGIDPNRLESKGYGDTMPIDSNDTEQGRAKNRRTELKVL